MLDEAEAKWAPPDDPVFQLVPSDVEPYMTRCFKDLGKPKVTYDTFWNVYRELRDLVEITVPGDIITTLSGSTRSDADRVLEPPEFTHLKEPELGGIEVEEDDDGNLVPCVDFTDEEGRDQLF